MKIKNLWLAICTTLLLCACDETTSTLGIELVPESDMVSISWENYNVELNTIIADSVLARTSTSHLGNYTDPETGTTVHGDYLMQLNCGAGFEFPDSIQNNICTSAYLNLYFNSFVGDSLAPCRVSVYPLNKVMDNSKSYYTDINPEDYYDTSASPLAVTTFTLSDRTISDEERNDGAYFKNVRIKLPVEEGNKMLKKYKQNPEYFKNGKLFTEKVNPGYFVKFEKGDGVMMDIYISQLNVSFKYFEKSSTGRLDSLVNGTSTFAGTEEVIQATAVKKYNLEKLLSDNEAAYIKSPSSLFTEVTLPISEIATTDTINSAKLIFDRYNSSKSNENYILPAPTYLLMVQKDKMYEFFEEYKIPDSNTSYMATFSAANNNYAFNNISHLISQIRKEHQEGISRNPNWEKENPNWNKVVLIPVSPILSTSTSSNSYYSYYGGGSNSQSTLVGMNHDLSLTSARLKKNGVTLQVIYSKFKK